MVCHNTAIIDFAYTMLFNVPLVPELMFSYRSTWNEVE